MTVTYDALRENPRVRTYIDRADDALAALGYTEHSIAHVTRVAEEAGKLLVSLGYDAHTVELARIAGLLHDIGNLVNREGHSMTGAVMAFRLLDDMGMDTEDLCAVVSAIGNHDEGTGVPVSPLAAALILADKSDVRRSRVRNRDRATFDIHDRVNFSAEESVLSYSPDHGSITLKLTIDGEISSVMEYFEIFLSRMVLCRRAAEKLGQKFRLKINGQAIL